MNWGVFWSAAGGCVVILAIFFVCRHLMCWYWKINEIVDLLKEIRDTMQAPEEKSASDKAA